MKTNVTFDSAGLKLAGHLYLPDSELVGPGPAIVVGHPGSSVKEQASGLYARLLAERGYITLAFDAAFQGESEGMPRGLEDPAHRVEDIKAAVSYLATRADVDPARIGALGICASGGYVIPAAAADHRIKAVASVCPVDINLHFRRGADGKLDPGVFQGLLDRAAQARTAQARGEGVATFPLFPTEAQARAGDRYHFEGWEYYCTDRAQHPRSTKEMPWVSVDYIACFDAFRFIDTITPRPLLMIAGREAATSWMAVDAIARAHEPKELVWIDGASHNDLYDKRQYVDPAVSRIGDFFRVL
ncbi:alpha/beta hydrolase [Burkholderia cenocepacia]|uniref:alpha/beta hydrolase n=1 Tax=Burkholderia cenocepacia TaxID=95486 RepID=UPI0023B8DFD6|nr:alpha/beta hydrolase [Burkholderia cenocepacia]MDF0504644.1 alpha/beta hydrolase [Burkholderia cenocepacia]